MYSGVLNVGMEPETSGQQDSHYYERKVNPRIGGIHEATVDVKCSSAYHHAFRRRLHRPPKPPQVIGIYDGPLEIWDASWTPCLYTDLQ